jgi:predicted AAA+ superfamily ATPase
MNTQAPDSKLLGLSTLLQLEKDIRHAEDIDKFNFLVVNDARRLIEQLTDNGQLSLESVTFLRGRSLHSQIVVIDEAQRLPDLFPVLRVLIDADRRPGRFLILGSASPTLVGLSSESLAGRIRLLELPGLRASDLSAESLDLSWTRGGLPPSTLAESDEASSRWRDDYISTFLERDLADLGVRVPATTMRRFWTMLAHSHGQTWNGADLARSLGVSEPTVRRYVDALTDALVVRQLQPWHANLKKRQVRSPKVFVRDSGLLHRLLGIGSQTDLDAHPKSGASWEGWVIEQLLLALDPSDASFWATHAGAELDLRLDLGGRVIGVEIKRTSAPSTTRSMHTALADLELDHLYVVHGGVHEFPLTEAITAVPARTLADDPTRLSRSEP